jgi:hypothetical protein
MISEWEWLTDEITGSLRPSWAVQWWVCCMHACMHGVASYHLWLRQRNWIALLYWNQERLSKIQICTRTYVPLAVLINFVPSFQVWLANWNPSIRGHARIYGSDKDRGKSNILMQREVQRKLNPRRLIIGRTCSPCTPSSEHINFIHDDDTHKDLSINMYTARQCSITQICSATRTS